MVRAPYPGVARREVPEKVITAAEPNPTSFFALGIYGRYVQAGNAPRNSIKGVGLAGCVVMKG
jgi:hypothetical protein